MSYRLPKNVPFSTTAASIKGNRNLLYLAAKGVIPAQEPSARVAQELTAANLAKDSRRQAAQFARARGAAIQAEANEKWLNGEEVNALGHPPRSTTAPIGRGSLLDGVEKFLNINAGRVR